jgi:hypothetical protein
MLNFQGAVLLFKGTFNRVKIGSVIFYAIPGSTGTESNLAFGDSRTSPK